MRLEQPPLFRRVFIPWYAADIACLLTAGFAVMVILFAAIGVSAAFAVTQYVDFVWVPVSLILLGLLLLLSVIFRLLRRHSYRFLK
ncbi:MAG: hypothetical protein JRH15_10000 [Deltaproteobacteria bacterium]|nr:hypothetical protein [Deltaproteobacteria bacterium]